MAYGVKYRFQYDSWSGVSTVIDILQDGYSGTVLKRALGRSPLLRKEKGEKGIYGTSLEIYAETAVDGEFSSLYTSDAREFKVELYRNSSLIWEGFVSPELYAEPSIAPPYDVQIIATDGLGELKNYDFDATPGVRMSLTSLLVLLLGNTGLPVTAADLALVSALQASTPSITSLFNVYLDPSHLSGKTCYEVLGWIMQTFNLTITQHACKWLLMRETDLVISGSTITATTGAGTSVTFPAVTFGSMRTNTWWPVGHLDQQVVPAKNRVTVDLPFQLRESMLTNPSFEDGTIAGWSGSGVTFDPTTYGVNKPVIAYNGGYLQQTLQVTASSGRFNLRCYAATIQSSIGTMEPSDLSFGIEFTLTGGGHTYQLLFGVFGWTWAETSFPMSAHLPVIDGNGSRLLKEQDFSDIGFEDIPGFPISGTLKLKLVNNSSRQSVTLVVGGAYLTPVIVNGYRDTVVLNNAARESLDGVTLSFGDAPSGLGDPDLALSNYLSNGSDVAASAWLTSRLSAARSFISLMALDYSMAYALPRLMTKGKLNAPDAAIPVALTGPDSILYILRTFDYDLYDDELQIEALSAPAVAISVASETIRALDNAEYQDTQISSGMASPGGAVPGPSSGDGVTLTFQERMGMVVIGSGTRNLGVELDPLREIPITNQMVKNNYPATDAIKQIVVCTEYPQEEADNTLYLLIEE